MPLSFLQLTRAFTDLLFPPVCMGCETPLATSAGLLLCPECHDQVHLIAEPLCPCCGKPYPITARSSHLCSECLTNKRHFDTARGILLYKRPVPEAVQRFKYRENFSGLAGFARLAEESPWVSPLMSEADLILPVPLHKKRLRMRTFNQAALLARTFAKPRRRDIRYEVLLRPGWSEPQTSKSGTARRKSLRNSFAVARPAAVRGRNILLVDDVFTTGTTVNECARVLKKSGAKTVNVLTLARVEK